MTLAAYIAVNRLGLGARVGETGVAEGDARGWLKAQLTGDGVMPQALAGLPGGGEMVSRIVRARAAERESRRVPGVPAPPPGTAHGSAPGATPGAPTAPGPAPGPASGLGAALAKMPSLFSALTDSPTGDPSPTLPRMSQSPMAVLPVPAPAHGGMPGQTPTVGVQDPARRFRLEMRDLYLREAGARLQAMVGSDQPFRERLVAFWSNHFTVSVARPVVAGLVGSFEREAIRPHVTGRFEDMLRAVVRHPAMLLYLDNAQSVGPNAPAGQGGRRGLNENLAREVLELHTLGVEGGYTQDDVRALAAILTGWSVPAPQDTGAGDGFVFRPPAHEPGDKLLLGVRYAQAGESEGIQALGALARHPATARHLAGKLARHFIADQPPASAVTRLEQSFRETGGDLGQMARVLVDSPEVWAEPQAKIKTPQDLVVSALRATGVGLPWERVVGMLRQLGQMPFAAPSPAGWADDAAHWIGPEAVMRRIEWCSLVGHRLAWLLDPALVLEAAIGPVARPETRRVVQEAASVGDAVTLILASPEFQRR